MEVDERAYKGSFMSTLHNLFSTTTVVKKLVGWRSSEDEEKWAEKAVETLVKKLKKKRGALDELQRAISNPEAPSRCVTIPRSIDGRLQILHRKAMPHVIYCKLWRWADLRSHHELQSVPCCKFAYNSKNAEVCINPYHYRRVESPELPDVIVSKQIHQRQDVQPLAPGERQAARGMPTNVTLGHPPEGASHGTCDDILSSLPEPTLTSEPHYNQQQSSAYSPPVDSEAVPYQEMACWATIAYYELNCRVGEPFLCTQPVISIDGYTSPDHDGQRFCLGKLSNVNRNSVIENVRQHIGHGVTLHYAGGQLFAECTSDRAVFVQSRIGNYLLNYNPTAVVKLQPGMTVKIFDTTIFSNILKRVVHHGFSAVYELIKVCTIRMSFVKGWGVDYHREDVTLTPCWVEITLNAPLKWLDNVLIGMGSPPNAISSVS